MFEDDEETQKYKALLAQMGFTPEQLEQFTPEQLKGMYFDYAGEDAIIAEQRKQAESMRAATQAGQGGIQAGNVFVADSPLETIAGIGGEYLNRREQKALNERQQQASDMKGQGQQDMAKLGAMGHVNSMQGDPRAAIMRQEEEEEERRRRNSWGY